MGNLLSSVRFSLRSLLLVFGLLAIVMACVWGGWCARIRQDLDPIPHGRFRALVKKTGNGKVQLTCFSEQPFTLVLIHRRKKSSVSDLSGELARQSIRSVRQPMGHSNAVHVEFTCERGELIAIAGNKVLQLAIGCRDKWRSSAVVRPTPTEASTGVELPLLSLPASLDGQEELAFTCVNVEGNK